MRLPLFFLMALCLSTLSAQPDVAKAAHYVCPPCNSKCDDLVFAAEGQCPHCGMELITKASLKKAVQPKRKKIAFYLQSGVEVLDFAGPMEVFSYAGYEVFTVSKTKAPIFSQGILRILPDYSIEDAPQADMLAFFGGNGWNTAKDTAIIRWVKKQAAIEHYFSVCTGAFILAEAGLLEGKTATTFHDALDNLADNYPQTKVLYDARFVDNGQVITTAGISAGIDGALHLVAKLQGFNAARKVAYHMEYDKWAPAEGLILDTNNPYLSLPSPATLSAYIGTYEYLNESVIQIRLNEREHGLEVVVGTRTFPLFYMGKDQFQDVSGAQIYFLRNAEEQLTSYQISEYAGQTFRKL
ncbi:MAG: DJ-1/PfpI family protein [Bacteroidota bacterium]